MPPNWRDDFALPSATPVPPMPRFVVVPPLPAERGGHDPTNRTSPLRASPDVAPAAIRLSALERSVLTWVDYHRCVTTGQILRKFWTAEQKTTRHGNRLLQRLRHRELLEIFQLEPAKGRASIRVARLTPWAHQALGITDPSPDARSRSGTILRYRLQFTETILTRGAEGWTWVPREEVSDEIRELGLKRYRGRVLNGTEQASRDLLMRLGPPDMPFHGLRHSSGLLRLIVPAHTLAKTRKALNDLPMILSSYTPELEVELVPIGHAEREAAERSLRAAETRLKVRFPTVCCPHFSVANVAR